MVNNDTLITTRTMIILYYDIIKPANLKSCDLVDSTQLKNGAHWHSTVNSSSKDH